MICFFSQQSNEKNLDQKRTIYLRKVVNQRDFILAITSRRSTLIVFLCKRSVRIALMTFRQISNPNLILLPHYTYSCPESRTSRRS